MKKLLTILFVFAGIAASAQWTPMKQKYQYPGIKITDSLHIPSDTTNNKTGIARIGTTLLVGNGSYWSPISGGGVSGVDTAGRFVNAITSPNDSTIVVCKGTGCTSYIIRGSPGQSIDTAGKFVNSVTFPTDSTAIVCKGGTCTQFSIKGGAGSSGGSQTDTTGKFVNSVVSNTDSTIIVCKAGTCIEYVIGRTIYAINPVRIIDSTDGKQYITSDTATLSNRIDQKLNISDTANKWVNKTYRRTDSIFYRIGGTEYFSHKDSIGGGSVNPYYLPYTSNDPFVKLYAGVIKGTAPASPNTPIVWAFLDTTSNGVHDRIGFDSVNGNGNIIQVFYPPVEHVVSFVVTPDESLATTGVQVGASVGVAGMASISAFRLTMNAGKLTGNTTAWTASGLSLSVNSYSTSTGLTSLTPAGNAGNFLGASNEIEGTQISYVGDQHYRIRRKYSGLGGLIGFYLVDSTNKIVTGNLQSTDVVTVMFGRPVTTPIPAQTVNSVLYPSDIYTPGSNYWITAVFKLWFRAYPENSTTNKMIWRNYKIGSNYATSYRITRAALSTPGTETTIYTGSAFACTDASATSGVQYIYRMYATVLGVESLVTNEKCITQ